MFLFSFFFQTCLAVLLPSPGALHWAAPRAACFIWGRLEDHAACFVLGCLEDRAAACLKWLIRRPKSSLNLSCLEDRRAACFEPIVDGSREENVRRSDQNALLETTDEPRRFRRRGAGKIRSGPGHIGRGGAWLNSVEGSLFYELNKASVDHAVGSKSYDARINTLGQRWTN